MNLDQRNWSELTEADRLRMIELEGYFVVPDLLQPSHTHSVLRCSQLNLPTTLNQDPNFLQVLG